MKTKYVYLKSFGCQMNRADSEQLLGILRQSGYRPTDSPDDADLILLNTCAIREKAEHKVFSDLGRFKVFKNKKPSLHIGVAGCVAQKMGAGILTREKAVDFVLGTQSMGDLPNLLMRVERGEKGVSLEPAASDEEFRSLSVRSSSVHAYVPIIYGCENFCAYCVVPYVRGPEKSRPPDAIIREVQDLAQGGYREVTLLGQNVNSYGIKSKDPIMFHQLVKLIHEVEGIERIRFVTSHPRDLSEEMVQAISDLPKVCEALHLPVQSGSDRILSSMNRGYTRSDYLQKLSLLRKKIPAIAVTTDMIVGFPGESESDFEETLTLISEAQFDHLFGFRYSSRSGTPAASLSDQIDETVKVLRLEQVFELQKKISLQKNRACVDQELEVLVDSVSLKQAGRLSGRSRTNKIVHFQGSAELLGRLVYVRIEKGLPNCLVGSVTSIAE